MRGKIFFFLNSPSAAARPHSTAPAGSPSSSSATTTSPSGTSGAAASLPSLFPFLPAWPPPTSTASGSTVPASSPTPSSPDSTVSVPFAPSSLPIPWQQRRRWRRSPSLRPDPTSAATRMEAEPSPSTSTSAATRMEPFDLRLLDGPLWWRRRNPRMHSNLSIRRGEPRRWRRRPLRLPPSQLPRCRQCRRRAHPLRPEVQRKVVLASQMRRTGILTANP
ncbi:hypothetical protein Taro_020195, partial [Colocasia esculenta]|nr:hypothetical protein [Colocasia esculenta]